MSTHREAPLFLYETRNQKVQNFECEAAKMNMFKPAMDAASRFRSHENGSDAVPLRVLRISHGVIVRG